MKKIIKQLKELLYGVSEGCKGIDVQDIPYTLNHTKNELSHVIQQLELKNKKS